MKVTNVYPPTRAWKQQPVGDGTTIEEVFQDIRRATNDGLVVLIETHQFAIADFRELLNKGRYVSNNLKVIPRTKVKQTVHIPAHPGSKLVHYEDGPGNEWVNLQQAQAFNAFMGRPPIVAEIEVVDYENPATPATTKEIEFDRFPSFATWHHAQQIKEACAGATTVVVWEPLDLDYINELPEHTHVVIYHPVCEQVGVVVEGDDNPDNWEEAFPIMGDCELPPPEVIVDEMLLKGCIHVFAGAKESYKTVANIELCTAILDNRPVFDHFKVRQQHPILYLCPDMSPELFQEYTRPFGLMGKSEFRWQDPKADVFHAIDSKMLERAVQGRILVLDTMLDYARIEKASESGEWITFFNKLRRLINVCGCVAIVMLVHPTKTGAESNTIDPEKYLKDSVTFGGKIDIGFAFSKLEDTSQIFVQRIKARGFKSQRLSFTIAYLDELGNSNLDRGHFPIHLKPGEAGKKEDHVAAKKVGRKANTDKQQKIDFARTVEGSMQQKADAVNEKFGSKHTKSTMFEWLKGFDEDKQ